jgi:predicted outer membrane repeat protein
LVASASVAVTSWTDLSSQVALQLDGSTATYALSSTFDSSDYSAGDTGQGIEVCNKYVIITGNNNQVLDASQKGPLFAVGNNPNAAGGNECSGASTLELSGNFELKNGKVSTAGLRYGGAFYINGDTATLTLTGIKISSCYAIDRGGAIHTTNGAQLTASSVVFDGNSALNSGAAVNIDGGGAATQKVVANFNECIFSNNKCVDDGCLGGALYIYTGHAHAQVTSSTFENNEAGFGGAIVVDAGCTLTVNGEWSVT